jgi:hypothetical protein
MSQPETTCIKRGEFTRHTLAEARPWAKQTTAGPAVDGALSWAEDKQGALWLAGHEGQPPSDKQRMAVCEAWRGKLAEPLRRLGVTDVAAHVVLHDHSLECWVPLEPPEGVAEALARWAVAVNTQTHLIAVNAAGTKASIFIPLLQPTEAGVELVDAALRYVAVELRPILEALRRYPGLAANWEQWLRASRPQERREPS